MKTTKTSPKYVPGLIEPETKEEAMLRTASTRTNPRSTPRPLTGGRPERLLDSTPVLFRLPTVDTLPLVVPDLPAEDLATTDVLASSTAASVAIPQAIESASLAAETVFSPAMPTANSAKASAMADTSAKPADGPQLFDEPRSWWEHWSSGVVLILLILALLVVSILAMKRPASNTSELMAEQSTAPDDLVIPTLEPQTSSSVGSLSQASEPTPPTTSLDSSTASGVSAPPVNSLSLVPGDMAFSTSPASAESPASADDSPAASSQAVNSQAATQSSTSAADQPLSLDVDLEFAATADKPEIGTQTELAANRPNAASSATLSPPIGIEPPSLFSEVELQFNESLPVAPVANQTVPATSGNREPRLHDEAMTLPASDPASLTSGSEWSQPSLLQQSGQNAPSAPAWPATSLAASGDQPQFSTAEATTSNPGGTLSTDMQNLPSVSSTAYPDLPADAIIRAWQKSKELNQSENNPANRYMTPSTSPGTATTNPAATTSGAATNNMRSLQPTANTIPGNTVPVNTAVPNTGVTAPVSGPYYPQLPNL